jgi:hypothetical protein
VEEEVTNQQQELEVQAEAVMVKQEILLAEMLLQILVVAVVELELYQTLQVLLEVMVVLV